MGKKKRKKQKIGQDFKKTAHTKQEKRQAVISGGTSGGSKSTLIGIAAAVIALAVVGFILFGGGTGGFDVVRAEAGVVRLPVSAVNDGQAHYYTYKGAGKDVNFFVLRSSDGIIRAAFDACDVCYREKKGYHQEGDLMVCNNCGQQFPSVKVNEIRGGCNPAPLDRQVDGDSLVLRAADIETGAFYF